jgi:hypothetical protein
LSIVETLCEFHNIILVYKIIVHTDHKKITYSESTSDIVMRCHLLIEEFGVDDSIILRKTGLQQKLSAPEEGPYTVLEVGKNGMVKI